VSHESIRLFRVRLFYSLINSCLCFDVDRCFVLLEADFWSPATAAKLFIMDELLYAAGDFIAMFGRKVRELASTDWFMKVTRLFLGLTDRVISRSLWTTLFSNRFKRLNSCFVSENLLRWCFG